MSELAEVEVVLRKRGRKPKPHLTKEDVKRLTSYSYALELKKRWRGKAKDPVRLKLDKKVAELREKHRSKYEAAREAARLMPDGGKKPTQRVPSPLPPKQSRSERYASSRGQCETTGVPLLRRNRKPHRLPVRARVLTIDPEQVVAALAQSEDGTAQVIDPDGNTITLTAQQLADAGIIQLVEGAEVELQQIQTLPAGAQLLTASDGQAYYVINRVIGAVVASATTSSEAVMDAADNDLEDETAVCNMQHYHAVSNPANGESSSDQLTANSANQNEVAEATTNQIAAENSTSGAAAVAGNVDNNGLASLSQQADEPGSTVAWQQTSRDVSAVSRQTLESSGPTSEPICYARPFFAKVEARFADRPHISQKFQAILRSFKDELKKFEEGNSLFYSKQDLCEHVYRHVLILFSPEAVDLVREFVFMYFPQFSPNFVAHLPAPDLNFPNPGLNFPNPGLNFPAPGLNFANPTSPSELLFQRLRAANFLALTHPAVLAGANPCHVLNSADQNLSTGCAAPGPGRASLGFEAGPGAQPNETLRLRASASSQLPDLSAPAQVANQLQTAPIPVASLPAVSQVDNAMTYEHAIASDANENGYSAEANGELSMVQSGENAVPPRQQTIRFLLPVVKVEPPGVEELNAAGNQGPSAPIDEGLTPSSEADTAATANGDEGNRLASENETEICIQHERLKRRPLPESGTVQVKQEPTAENAVANDDESEPCHFCRLCGNLSLRGAEVPQHVFDVHCHERPFICSVCDIGFLTRRSAESHFLCHPDSDVDDGDIQNDCFGLYEAWFKECFGLPLPRGRQSRETYWMPI